MAAVLSSFIQSADTLVVAIPTVVFITLLPGLLYFELAFDIQRSVWLELLLCLFPASAASLLLRIVCAYEAVSVRAGWFAPGAPVSQTAPCVYIFMLLVDLVLYGVLAYFLSIPHKKTIQADTLSPLMATAPTDASARHSSQTNSSLNSSSSSSGRSNQDASSRGEEAGMGMGAGVLIALRVVGLTKRYPIAASVGEFVTGTATDTATATGTNNLGNASRTTTTTTSGSRHETTHHHYRAAEEEPLIATTTCGDTNNATTNNTYIKHVGNY
jgi:hypothetical protein